MKNLKVVKPRIWYVEDVNIHYSFEMLQKIAESLGAEIDVGDILVVDNIKKDRRKLFKRIKNGVLIVYVKCTNGETFEPLMDSGKHKLLDQKTKILAYFK